MGKVKRIGSNKKTLAALATAFLVLVLVVIGFASQETTSAGYGYGGDGGGGGGGGEPQPVDTTPPVISETSISASAVTSTSATISWTTDEPSTSQVEYWPGSLSALDTTLVTTHSVTLNNLIPETNYRYRAMSMDADGNLTVSEEHTFSTLSAPDTTPPVISAVSVSDVTSDGATISWTTDEPSTSQVEYRVTTSSLSSLNATMVTSHTVILTDLSSDTTYNFKVRSNDASGNLAVSDEYIFTTLAAPANWAFIGGIIGAVVAAGGLAWYLWWRRRG